MLILVKASVWPRRLQTPVLFQFDIVFVIMYLSACGYTCLLAKYLTDRWMDFIKPLRK